MGAHVEALSAIAGLTAGCNCVEGSAALRSRRDSRGCTRARMGARAWAQAALILAPAVRFLTDNGARVAVTFMPPPGVRRSNSRFVQFAIESRRASASPVRDCPAMLTTVKEILRRLADIHGFAGGDGADRKRALRGRRATLRA